MTQSLLEAVMALPPEERAKLAERLWDSLPSEIADTCFAEDLAREVRLRRERHLQDGSSIHSWTDVRGELDEIIAQFDKP
jgi:putative addiction module component (TIGR02574 family)